MIAENSTKHSIVPVEPWRPHLTVRAGNLGMRAIGLLGSTLSSIFGNRAPETFGILTYHRIASRTANVPLPPYNVEPSRFREQVTGLLKRGLQFVPLREAIRCHEAGTHLPPQSVVMTFDDCFESVYTQAWPTLREFEIPATLFLSTAYMDSDAPFPFDTWADEFGTQVPSDHFRPIRATQCREMAATGLIEIGTHTQTHADFREHVEEFAEEMTSAAEVVQEEFGVTKPTFSLPFGNPSAGYASPELLAAVRQSGAVCALTTEAALVDVTTDPFGWGRLNVFAWDTSATLAGKLCGWYDWAPRCKHRLGHFLKDLTKS